MEDTELAEPASDRRDEAREFGARVHRLRERAGLTLAQLSDKSGVSRAMLSKVERGEQSPTIGVAKRIAHALDKSLSFLTAGREEHRASAVVRGDERPVFRDPKTGFERHVLSPVLAGNNTEVVYHHLPAKVGTGPLPPYPAGTEKHVVVAQGEVVIEVRGTETHLFKNDTFFFEADLEHSFRNPTARPCGYYLFISRCV